MLVTPSKLDSDLKQVYVPDEGTRLNVLLVCLERNLLIGYCQVGSRSPAIVFPYLPSILVAP